ncbi:MAG: hypothetical protein IH612_21025 [Desulfofustis sp.]|nr:hypothetical protein [Desulfofustis sp.]
MKPVKQPTQIKNFVQQTLGCGCPESVFQSMLTDQFTLPEVPNAPIIRLLIGQRLLIYLVASNTGRPWSPGQLTLLTARGLQEREQHGYNRLRLVIILAEHTDHQQQTMERSFSALQGTDDRLHLHVISARDSSLVGTGLLPHAP